jgi:ankyrin repeat protein
MTEKNVTPLHQVAYNNDEAMLDYLISKGIKMEGPWSEFGSPFMWACAEGHLKMMQRISEMKDFSGVDDQDKNGGTALHISCATGNSKVVDWLIKKVRHIVYF